MEGRFPIYKQKTSAVVGVRVAQPDSAVLITSAPIRQVFHMCTHTHTHTCARAYAQCWRQ